MSSLIKSQGVGDLYELYLFARRNNMDYNLAYIPANFIDTSTQSFDPVYMNGALIIPTLKWVSEIASVSREI